MSKAGEISLDLLIVNHNSCPVQILELIANSYYSDVVTLEKVVELSQPMNAENDRLVTFPYLYNKVYHFIV